MTVGEGDIATTYRLGAAGRDSSKCIENPTRIDLGSDTLKISIPLNCTLAAMAIAGSVTIPCQAEPVAIPALDSKGDV